MSRSRKRRVTGVEALEQAYGVMNHGPLLERLGVDVDDEHLRLALTHRSFANENGGLPNNERLEFLGDAVLGLSVAEQLYKQYPDRPESDISKMRASIVSRYGCADVARDIGLGEYVLLGKGELATGGRGKESILADTTEAVLGAIYHQHGFETTRDVVLRLFGEKIDNAVVTGRTVDSKTNLQERLAELKAPMAEYRSTSVGPDHDLLFTTEVVVAGVVLGNGTGGNKKVAEQQAAFHALNLLREHPEMVAGRA